MPADPKNDGWLGLVPVNRRTAVLGGVGFVAILILLIAGFTNIVVVIFACAVLLLLGRTVGDWLADLVGPGARSVLVAAVLFMLGWQLVSSAERRAAAIRFLGLDSYWVIDDIPEDRLQVCGGSSAGPSTGSARSGPPARPPSPAAPSTPAPAASAAPQLQMAVNSVSDAGGVRLEARLTGARQVSGIVDFFIDGNRVAAGSVRPDGTATGYVPNLPPGSYRVEARFKGRGGTGEASAQTSFRRD